MKRDKQISTIVRRLREFHWTDGQKRIGSIMLRSIEDPLKPKTPNGRLRINPILVLITVIAAFGVGTFLLCSLIQP